MKLNRITAFAAGAVMALSFAGCSGNEAPLDKETARKEMEADIAAMKRTNSPAKSPTTAAPAAPEPPAQPK